MFDSARERVAVSSSRNAVNFSSDFSPTRIETRDAVIRVYDDAGKVIETHEHNGDFKES